MPKKREKKPDATSSFAGAGGGTLLIGLSALIPDDHPVIKNCLTFASPAAAVAISFASLLLITATKRAIMKSQINSAIAEARKIRDEVNRAPTSTAAHKKQVQQNVEKFEALALELLNDNVEEVRARLRDIDP